MWRWPVRLGCLLLLCASATWADERAGISDAGVTGLANRAMSEFDVPGMAIGIVKADKILFSEGFG